MQSLFKFFLKFRSKRIKKFLQYPHTCQHQLLQQLVKTAKNTAFGRRYAFRSIHSVEKFSSRVPVSTYEQLHPYVYRVLQGEEQVLWPTPVQWFAKSSGTTNGHSKYIPISKQSIYQGHYQAGYDMLSFYLQQVPNTQIFRGKNIAILNTLSFHPDFPKANFRVGDISTILYKNIPSWGRKHQLISDDILQSDWEQKIRKIQKIACHQNITSLTGIPTWIWRLLEVVLKENNTKSIHNVWPHLELFIHGAVSFKPYQSLFDGVMHQKMHYLEVYNATEGFFSFQDDLKQKDMLLLLNHGIFYEFIPIESLSEEKFTTVALEDVEMHKIYALVITTNAGLWRYLIGDTIIFTKKDPYKIRIVGRTKQFINIFGEELIIENAEMALTEACKKTDAILCNYTAGPVYMEKNQKVGGHEWLIEFHKNPVNKEAFLDIFDQSLKQVNADYKVKRNSNIMYKPKVRFLAQGTFYQWIEQKNKLGGQTKVPRLANDRFYLTEILKMIQPSKHND